MAPLHPYFIIPPHLLQALAESTDVSHETRQQARASLSRCERLVATRLSCHHDQTQQEAARDQGQKQEVVGDHDQKQVAVGDQSAVSTVPLKIHRLICNANHTEDEAKLPGPNIRSEGQKPSSDKPANEVYDNFGTVLEFYNKLFGWKSLNNRNMRVVGSVHYGRSYQNAYWDPSIKQMVFGDGGDMIDNFTGALDVIGHEMTHAVTEHTCQLNYEGQAGALNEHLSDAFGIMIKQWKLGQTSAEADWLIGEDCLMRGVKGVALRSMKAPGTAYDDPRFGKDPQPDNYNEYKAMDDDNGGVHIYSGIPNKAFYLCAVGFGGHSWEKAGPIWWKTMTGGEVSQDSTFLEFAKITIGTAKRELGDDAADVVQKAWETVGVMQTPGDDGGSGDNDGGEGGGEGDDAGAKKGSAKAE